MKLNDLYILMEKDTGRIVHSLSTWTGKVTFIRTSGGSIYRKQHLQHKLIKFAKARADRAYRENTPRDTWDHFDRLAHINEWHQYLDDIMVVKLTVKPVWYGEPENALSFVYDEPNKV